jgi:hypothetical protein
MMSSRTKVRDLTSIATRYPHLNPLNAPPSRDPWEADVKRLVRAFKLCVTPPAAAISL